MRLQRPSEDRLAYVDALRGLAIAAVVLFHADVPGFPGGYAGVDVFLVISGFVMGRWVHGRWAANRFTYAEYFSSRVRRLVPALSVMSAVVVISGFLWLLPDELALAAKHAAASLLFVSNLVYWKEAGYFDPAAWMKPFWHTWSLSIEGQFYLLFPAAFLWCLNRGRAIRWVILGIAISFALALLAGYSGRTIFLFFMLPTRAWEFLLGTCAFLLPPPSARLARLAGPICIAGLLAIVYAVLFYRFIPEWPGPKTLLPCLGTAAILWAAPATQRVRNGLENRWLLELGKLSYSLYLWHWPSLWCWRLLWPQQHLGPVGVSAALASAMVLAWMSWRWVERPTHRMNFRIHSTALRTTGLGFLTVLVVAVSTWAMGGVPARLNESALASSRAKEDFKTMWDAGCPDGLKWGNKSEKPPFKTCFHSIPAEHQPLWVVWGDSHAHSLFETIAEQASLRGRAAYLAAMGGCPPVQDLREVLSGELKLQKSCQTFNQEISNWLLSDPRIETVWIAARWPEYIEGPGFSRPEAYNAYSTLWLRRQGTADVARSIQGSLGQTIQQLLAHNKKVVLVGPIPELRENAPSCLAGNTLPLRPSHRCETSYDAVRKRQENSVGMLTGLKHAFPKMVLILPSEYLCRDDWCSPEQDGKVLYGDDNHLTLTGTRELMARIVSARALQEE